MLTSTLTSKGQTTIPRDIRRQLGIEPGDRLEYVVDAQGRVVLLPATKKLKDLQGVLRHRAPQRAYSLEEMDDAIRDGASA